MIILNGDIPENKDYKGKEEDSAKGITKTTIRQNELLLQAMKGLAGVVHNRKHRPVSIKNEEILSFCSLTPEAMQFYYGNADSIINDMYREAEMLFMPPGPEAEKPDAKTVLNIVFRRLGKEEVLVETVIALEDFLFWKTVLRPLRPYFTDSWKSFSPMIQNELFEAFSCQFHSILKKWLSVDFALDHVNDCIRLAEVWIETDAMIGDTVEHLLNDWNDQ